MTKKKWNDKKLKICKEGKINEIMINDKERKIKLKLNRKTKKINSK